MASRPSSERRGGKRELVPGHGRDDPPRDLDEPRAAGIDDARVP